MYILADVETGCSGDEDALNIMCVLGEININRVCGVCGTERSNSSAQH